MNRPEPAAAEVLIDRRGRLGHITLNRPRAINALTVGMVADIQTALDEWEADPAIQTVLITGAGDRGLCAGGDIVSLYRDARDGDGAASARFWRDEYRLNAHIARYPKPYVAIMDGTVLGGGVGVSAHGSHRIVTERTAVGMPETSIGFVPDVGGAWLLTRAPGELGLYLALTARPVGAGDAIALGLADSCVPSERLPTLIAALESTPAAEAIAAVATPAPQSPLLAERPWIDAAFSAHTVTEISARLRASPEPAAQQAADALAEKSPTALAVTLEALRRARQAHALEDVLRQDYRVSLRSLAAADFAEGVRAQVIDKDRRPRWRPAELSSVTDADVAAYFAPLGDAELTLTARHPTPPNV
ncbi:enoyl-CoA hydratase/isomerase family protein [Salinibacterium sp. ZJ450]|uniref:enoyl-CoA hydratase/isomerase family protein n=1 Tax=Salinibacterium sp. ZJ450 TaxID=2708338 RepID=UPI001424156A|nr:enoyl-CoA hydratase/isomerase family protein [Salinibacterium sp. ZJ450]